MKRSILYIDLRRRDTRVRWRGKPRSAALISAATTPSQPANENKPAPAGTSNPGPPGLLVVGNFLSRHGKNQQVCELLTTALQARGWTVVWTSDRLGRAARAIDIMGTIMLRRHDYAVAHVDVFTGLSFRMAEFTCALLGALGKPYAVTLHGGRFPDFARRFPDRVRRFLQKADVVLAPSDYLIEAMTPYRADIRLIPNPVPVGRYTMRIRDHPQPRLVWLRAFHRSYNPSLAPAVLAQLLPNFPEATLAMVGPDKGDGSYAATLAAADELGVADRLLTPGGVSKDTVPGWLDRGDVFLNTANVDNTPISVLEAMASGLCVVSTDVGGLPYLIEDGSDGLLVPPKDGDAMAHAVTRVLREPGLAPRLSAHARLKAESFDAPVVFSQWEQLFAELANAGHTSWRARVR